ncbi:hypothetical protein B0T11DRAFT_323213 [Plectosphaerella cucumerina]|uniref:Uncharacterized protein n=1 Tax=Plectosphaerella cucumerina TaxID=40658 RepID=A0A8K0TMP6_9PEZI|nr:hypothetical protein B0T11DRAFT_323213 [Plectosphaerella cucumerina]
MALASTAVAQQARVFTRASQSIGQFGIFGRQTDGYQPEDEVCGGEGSTCAEACGSGYEQCSSSDSAVHCFNPADGESCCASGDGSSCLASFYCSRSPDVETFCCPAGSTLKECATEFGVTGGLVSDLPSAPPSSSAPAPESTSSELPSSSSEIVVVATTTSAVVISSALPSTGFTSAYVNTTAYEPSYTLPQPTTTLQNDPSATSSTSEGESEDGTDESAAATHGPAAVALVAAFAMLATLF